MLFYVRLYLILAFFFCFNYCNDKNSETNKDLTLYINILPSLLNSATAVPNTGCSDVNAIPELTEDVTHSQTITAGLQYFYKFTPPDNLIYHIDASNGDTQSTLKIAYPNFYITPTQAKQSFYYSDIETNNAVNVELPGTTGDFICIVIDSGSSGNISMTISK
ncbi:hypothetical protein EHQ82_09695 [Leptospira selangorensis]|uniref:Uncharacterized protein n=1 Tax=Leptospira selangorensis TaxID=2484982 RepID=A0ABY2NC44_9LEPT|nr:hypothetical protein [Leptospira selangorensis]TGM21268.1 hypothetical protein EHQ82_09695 [Leptospira selangorensis]